ncbi:hypothetical protein L226DRAFT_575654 [Lentinus tigrinus ALCF2SS1-7]|uniref:Fungal-type protein kinase domain-containing protein n=1 Tax=Lentinus tigrinus ALCF2SS1-6 TaxID=1328759 RepID=A0A5C2RW08_9APHY|nr:hypothetical protein L227DRAFT_616122 [Lentinus tigrinus ALCF2SS1-6]RPD69339.1 hypothetical protein L226DRAFT_575654 [Lentinus tigrinus ALCF2SS1-7]
MAHLERLAKAGKDWTASDLDAFNIQVVCENAKEFFRVPELPQVPPTIPRELLTTAADLQDFTSRELPQSARNFLVHLADSMPQHGNQALIAGFAQLVLDMTGFRKDMIERVVLQRHPVRFRMDGSDVIASPACCLMKRTSPTHMHMLFVEVHKEMYSAFNAVARLVADAIAGFQHNNTVRRMRAEPERKAETFVGIAFVFASPTFYKITVTQELSKAVNDGTYADDRTIIEQFVPRVPRPETFDDEGMKDVRNRSWRAVEFMKLDRNTGFI